MLGVEIEFGNDWTQPETSNYKPKKAKTPARTRGFSVSESEIEVTNPNLTPRHGC
jgi:hypothetical protein